MQETSVELDLAIKAPSQRVVAKVEAQLTSTANISNADIWSSSDLYSQKTLSAGAELYWRMNDQADYASTIIEDDPVAYFRMDGWIAYEDKPGYALVDETKSFMLSFEIDAELAAVGAYRPDFRDDAPVLDNVSMWWGGLGFSQQVLEMYSLVAKPSDRDDYGFYHRSGLIPDINAMFAPVVDRPFAIELWVKPENALLGAVQSLVSRTYNPFRRHDDDPIRQSFDLRLHGSTSENSAPTNQVEIIIWDKQNAEFIHLGSDLTVLAHTVQADKWSQIVLSWDGHEQLNVYVNSALVLSKTITSVTVDNLFAEAQVVAIGGRIGGVSIPNAATQVVRRSIQDTFLGGLDEISFYTHPLSQYHVTKHWQRAQRLITNDYSGHGMSGVNTGYALLGTPPLGAGPLDNFDKAYCGGTRFLGGGTVLYAGANTLTLNSKLNPSSAFTIEAWVQLPSHQSGRRTVVSKSLGVANNLNSYRIEVVGDGAVSHVECSVFMGGVQKTAGSAWLSPINPWKWHYIVLQVRNETLSLFLNGIEVAYNNSIGDINVVDGPFTVGYLPSTPENVNYLNAAVSEVAFYNKALFDNKSILARYTSAIAPGTGFAAIDRFTPEQAISSIEDQTFLWSVVDNRDDSGSVLTAGSARHVTETNTYSIDPSVISTIKYGCWFKMVSDGNGRLPMPEIYSVRFDAILAEQIKVMTAEFDAGFDKYSLYYMTNDSVWVTVGSNMSMGDTYYRVHDIAYGEPILIKGICIIIHTMRIGCTVAKLQSLTPLWTVDMSDDVTQMDIKKVRESYDTTVPLGATAANTCSLILDNTSGDYNPHNTDSPYYGYIEPKVKVHTDIGYFIDQSYEAVQTFGTQNFGYGTLGGDGAGILQDNYEYISQGDYIIDSWSVDSSSMVTTAQSRDDASLMQNENNHFGYLVEKATAGRAIGDMAKIAGVANNKLRIQDTYKNTINTPSLSAHWPMSDFGDSVQVFDVDGSDLSPNHRTELYTPNLYGAGGVDNVFTLETWVMFKDFANKSAFWLYEDPSFGLTMAHVVEQTTGALTIDGQPTGVVFDTNTWYHIATVYNYGSNTCTLYINGAETFNGGAWGFSDGGGRFSLVGNNAVLQSSALSGAITDFRFWNKALTWSDIANNLSVAPMGHEDGLFISLNMNTVSKSKIYNGSSGSNNFIIQGTQHKVTSGRAKSLVEESQDCNGTYVGCTFGAPGPSTNALETSVYFNGTSDYAFVTPQPLKLTSLYGGSACAVEVWIKPEDFNETRFFFTYGRRADAELQVLDMAPFSIGMGVDEDGCPFLRNFSGAGTGGTDFVSEVPIPMNEWSHLVFNIRLNDAMERTKDIDLYQNSVKTISGEDVGITSSNMNDHIVLGYNGIDGFWRGWMTRLSIMRNTLSDAEVFDRNLAMLAQGQKVYKTLWAGDTTLWEAALQIAAADLGMFHFDESSNFIYEPTKRYYDPYYAQHSEAQYELSDTTNIVSASVNNEVQINKISIDVNKLSTAGGATQQLWAAEAGSSLAMTTALSDLYIHDHGGNAYVRYNTVVNTAGVREPAMLPGGLIKIGNEIIRYDSSDEFRLLGLTRGMFNTVVEDHFINDLLTEVREYDMTWSTTPAFNIKYPFITAELFDNKTESFGWRYDSIRGHIVIAMKHPIVPSDVYQTLEGPNPVTGLNNYFHVAGSSVTAGAQAEKVEVVSDNYLDSLRRYGVMALSYSNPYITDVAYAREIIKFLLTHFKNPVPIVKVEVMGIPQLQLSDRIVITDFAALDLSDKEYWVMEININYNGGINQSMSLREVS